MLDAVSTARSQLDADAYPLARRIVAQVRDHDDRMDDIIGTDLILGGIIRQRASSSDDGEIGERLVH